ncbi:MAG: hypothetical protein JHC26_07980 [Thermofilum sp.]|jgi:multisubunit Na+/H+ antiporter MnhG subunit|uniref:hypothetical protein n=1 Tax=Thermofilum sp. TaxID=1961369 RepID=UPI0025912660|nr:hypothetical protein [Thermofilum sp.]MCI4409016.1 hypothetical protein [Thermofilum sp.]
MNEAVKVKIVFYAFVVLAVVIMYLGILLALDNYKGFKASENIIIQDWKRHTCCYDTCEYSDDVLKLHLVILTITSTLTIAMVAIAIAIWLYNKGYKYYKQRCPEEKTKNVV